MQAMAIREGSAGMHRELHTLAVYPQFTALISPGTQFLRNLIFIICDGKEMFIFPTVNY